MLNARLQPRLSVSEPNLFFKSSSRFGRHHLDLRLAPGRPHVRQLLYYSTPLRCSARLGVIALVHRAFLIAMLATGRVGTAFLAVGQPGATSPRGWSDAPARTPRSTTAFHPKAGSPRNTRNRGTRNKKHNRRTGRRLWSLPRRDGLRSRSPHPGESDPLPGRTPPARKYLPEPPPQFGERHSLRHSTRHYRIQTPHPPQPNPQSPVPHKGTGSQASVHSCLTIGESACGV
jgi:hypothetical protein